MYRAKEEHREPMYSADKVIESLPKSPAVPFMYYHNMENNKGLLSTPRYSKA